MPGSNMKAALERRVAQQKRDCNLAIVLICTILMFLVTHTPRYVTDYNEGMMKGDNCNLVIVLICTISMFLVTHAPRLSVNNGENGWMMTAHKAWWWWHISIVLSSAQSLCSLSSIQSPRYVYGDYEWMNSEWTQNANTNLFWRIFTNIFEAITINSVLACQEKGAGYLKIW